MKVNKVKNTVFWIILFDFIFTLLLFSPLADIFLLPVNIIQHIFAVVFFALLGYMLFLLSIKKQYQNIDKSAISIVIWLVFLVLIFFIAQDYYYTIVTPHPFFHDKYFI